MDEWETTDTALEVAVSSLIYKDWQQTKQFVADGDRETNPVLGSRPSQERIDALIGLGYTAQLILAIILPKKARRLGLASLGICELLAVMNNHKRGY
jgi:hypothetical protein